jgi:acyl-CoA thioesterase-2
MEAASAAQRRLSLEELVTLELVSDDVFEAPMLTNPPPRLFGGQLVAQALAAGLQTVPVDRLAHSVHVHFLRPGDGRAPLHYTVDRLREGRSFSTRHVTATQAGKRTLVATISCQPEEPGLDFAPSMPDVPGPEGLRSESQVRLDEMALGTDTIWLREPRFPYMHYDLRPVHPRRFSRPHPQGANQAFWFRLEEAPPKDARTAQAMFAFMSDMMLLSTTLLPHGIFWTTTPMQEASLDHALWLHRVPRLDEWMLWDLTCEWTGSGRGLARGRVFSADGQPIATAMQEGLIRVTDG